MEGDLPSYQLSTTLVGHQADVRVACDVDGDRVATAGFDQVAKLWDVSSQPPVTESPCIHTYLGHSRYVYSLAFIKPTTTFPNGLIATGSVDTNIHLYDPNIPDSPLRQMVGHTQAVCSLNTDSAGNILSASWDGTAKVWDTDGTCLCTLEGHGKSVLCIIAHPQLGKYITCSADLSIKIWNGATCIATMTGHTDVPRCLTMVDANTLASCANDATVRLWDLTTATSTGAFPCHNGVYAYSITAIRANVLASATDAATGEPACTYDFATCGEDGSVAIWRGGRVVQTILLPCISVWSVACRANGDVVVACDDGMARVFSCAPARCASDEVLLAFHEHVAQVSLARSQQSDQGQIGDLNTKDLVGPEALTKPGREDGQILLVKEPSGKVMAHSWSASAQHWNCVGLVSDAKDTDSVAPAGWKYFDVELDGRKMKCKHKLGDNPFLTAQRFLDENNLEQDHLDDVATFVERHCGTPTLEFSAPRATPTVPGAYVPGSGGTAPPPTAPTYTSRRPVVPGAYVPGGATARVQTHDFPQEEFVYLAAVKLDGLRRKLEEFNADVSDPELALNVGEMTVLFKGLEKVVESACDRQAVVFADTDIWEGLTALCHKLLQWPVSKRFPAIDVLRLLLTRDEFKRVIFADGRVISEKSPLSTAGFLPFCMEHGGLLHSGDSAHEPPSAAVKMLTLRALANAFATGPAGAHMLTCLPELLTGFEQAFGFSGLPKHVAIAAATVLLNAAVAVRPGPQAVQMQVLRVCGKALEQLADDADAEVLYRVLVGVGTLVASSDTALGIVSSLPAIGARVRQCQTADSAKLKRVAATLASKITV
eukprot:m.87254 g.87254  ORF g.87254 m.87254 type:complete len:826 (-) comp16396_c1_seq10:135-2612(-)